MEVFSVLPIYSKLVKAGIRIWVYRYVDPAINSPVCFRHCKSILVDVVKISFLLCLSMPL